MKTQCNASLRIVDINGRLVDTLLEGQVQPGRHKIQFQAEQFSNGIYFAQLVSGDYIETQKMILIK